MVICRWGVVERAVHCAGGRLSLLFSTAGRPPSVFCQRLARVTLLDQPSCVVIAAAAAFTVFVNDQQRHLMLKMVVEKVNGLFVGVYWGLGATAQRGWSEHHGCLLVRSNNEK